MLWVCVRAPTTGIVAALEVHRHVRLLTERSLTPTLWARLFTVEARSYDKTHEAAPSVGAIRVFEFVS